MKIYCFGDSNTFGFDPRSYFGSRYPSDGRWVDIVAKKSGWSMENGGENGKTIPSLDYEITLYSRIFSQHLPDLLIIMLGSNDILQGLSAKAASARMIHFISGINIDNENILLVSPPPFTDGLWIEDAKYIEYSIQLGHFYKEISQKLGINFIDSSQWNIPLCYDGVHFTEEGHKIFAENMHKTILAIKEK